MKIFFVLVLTSLLAGCGGIPLGSLPRLAQLQHKLMYANPAEFMIAIQVDDRMVPPAGATPMLLLAIRPSAPGRFEIIDKKLPMHFVTVTANTLKLSPPPAQRRWLIYSLTPESQTELLHMQKYFRRIQAQQQGKGSGDISIGIAQDGVAAKNPELANTQWESWLQISREEGFFKLWSGSVAELLKQAKSQHQ
jgi:hypothetical protein